MVRVSGSRNRLTLGEPDGSLSLRLETLAALPRGDGMTVEVIDRIRYRIRAKLLLNLANGPLAALTASSQREIMSHGPPAQAATRIVHEGAAVARALGCEPGAAEIGLPSLASSAHRPSILQDLERGRRMEIGALHMAPLDFARELGVAPPTLDPVVALASQSAPAAGPYDFQSPLE